jgi:hypothetical protein
MLSGDVIGLSPDRTQAFSSQILRACRQIHQEASPVLYGRNAFSFWLDALDSLRQSLGDANMAQMSKLGFFVFSMWDELDIVRSSADLEGAANGGVFSGLRVFDALFIYKIDYKGAAVSHLVKLFAFLKRLIDDSDLPRLDRIFAQPLDIVP